jgi:hypothetical protein
MATTISAPTGRLTALHTPGHMGGHLCLCPGRTCCFPAITSWAGPPASSRRPMATWGPTWPRSPGWRQRPWRGSCPVTATRSTDPAARLAELIAPPPRPRGAASGRAAAESAADWPVLTARVYTDIPPPCCPPPNATSWRILLICRTKPCHRHPGPASRRPQLWSACLTPPGFFPDPPLPPPTTCYRPPVFRRSSAVEQLTVNQLVVGSIPTAGAIRKSPAFRLGFFFFGSAS